MSQIQNLSLHKGKLGRIQAELIIRQYLNEMYDVMIQVRDENKNGVEENDDTFFWRRGRKISFMVASKVAGALHKPKGMAQYS
jgi:hypothetical protein